MKLANKRENCIVSLVVPTYNEKKNISLLVDELAFIGKNKPYNIELIIVDDNSPDGTGKMADVLAKKYSNKKFKVVPVHRQAKFGLGTAVVAGFEKASGEILGVMDADLSHPPSIIPELIAPLITNTVATTNNDFNNDLENKDIKDIELTVGSRLVNGGGVEVWPWYRKLISLGATILARPITRVRDPMSGLFFFKKHIIRNLSLGTQGYKIGLEIFVKADYTNFKEIPYMFRNREFGKSKLGAKIYWDYLKDLWGLYLYTFFKKNL